MQKFVSISSQPKAGVAAKYIEPANNKQLVRCVVGSRVWWGERECFVRSSVSAGVTTWPHAG